jgi:murein L,D-transpeptidase YcbB/YkuD
MRRKALFLLAGLTLPVPPALAETPWSHDAAAELLGVAEQAGQEGLDPVDYDAAPLRLALAGTDDSALQAKASAVFLHLASDFAQGHVRNRKALAWYIPGPSVDPDAGKQQMEAALAGGGVRLTLQRLLPQHRQYAALKAALATTQLRDIAGSQRLRANLERWRWMPRELGQRYLLVNVPAFTVSLVENNAVVARHRVIVGKAATPTPQFTAQVTGAIFNPWWDIPASIVRESVGKLVAAYPAQARAKGYVAVGGRYRQLPGPGNALGQVKLVMPNPYSVYLHDTPNKELFDAEVRGFSHGCIRTQDVLGLAEALLAATPRWNRARIDGELASGRTTQAVLTQPVPIYVAYFTVAADETVPRHLRTRHGDHRYPD